MSIRIESLGFALFSLLCSLGDDKKILFRPTYSITKNNRKKPSCRISQQAQGDFRSRRSPPDVGVSVALRNMVSVSFGALVTILLDVAPSLSYERLMDIDIDMYMSETTPSSRMALNTIEKSKNTLR
jgi:hypothetical protein